MNPIYSYFKSPWAPSCFSQSVFSQSSNSFPAEDKCLLGPHLNQHNTEDEFLCNGLPSHSSKLFHRLHNANTQKKTSQEDPERPQDQPGLHCSPSQSKVTQWDFIFKEKKKSLILTKSPLVDCNGGGGGGGSYNAQSQG